MTKKYNELELKSHEKMAKDCFNKTWTLLEKANRTEDEDNEMVHTAHASRYHWGILVANGKGKPVNLQRGEWQIARVYTVLNRVEPALHHAKLCLKLTEDNDIKDFDLGFAYEAMARAMAAAGDKTGYEKYIKLVLEAGEKIKDKGDRDYFFEDLHKGQWFGMKK